MGKLLQITLFLILTSSSLFAQSKLNFPAKDLQMISQRYTGNSSNWPLVVEMAEHDANKNTFILSSPNILQLQNFSSFSTSVVDQKGRIGQLINSGATVFAADEYALVNDHLQNYNKAVNTGDIEAAISYAENLKESVARMKEILEKNRVVDIQAQLSKKKGQVDKRAGLLGGWENAWVGDLFKQSDGIRTLIESFATLSFTDGSDIQINPNTVAVIRKSRIDKLTNATDNEITLENGELLAKLSAAGKNRSQYILNAGPSRSELKTQNFYAEATGEEMAKLSNYEGEVVVNSNNITLTIRENEGTIVEDGKDPMQPVQLLPAPVLNWASTDTVINKDQLLFSYQVIDRAVSYRIQYSSSSKFDGDVTEIITDNSSVSFDDLPMGMTYARVQATDQLGLRGPYSKVARIIRTEDNKPPLIYIDDSINNILLAVSDEYTLKGLTEPDATLMINSKQVPVRSSGRFSHLISGVTGETELQINSKDLSGNQTNLRFTIVRLTENLLFNFNLRTSSALTTERINAGKIMISATAYPGLKVNISNEQQNRSISTDSQGRWGISTTLIPGDLTIYFEDLNTGQIYFSKSYIVEGEQ
ncbi:MAG: FecR domain-containing protein [Gracilimonas sp.]